VEAYVALRDHVATNDSHLPFLKGERIIVTSKPSADTWIVRGLRAIGQRLPVQMLKHSLAGWFGLALQGECEGNTGSFPSSFVRPVLGNLKPTAERTPG